MSMPDPTPTPAAPYEPGCGAMFGGTLIALTAVALVVRGAMALFGW